MVLPGPLTCGSADSGSADSGKDSERAHRDWVLGRNMKCEVAEVLVWRWSVNNESVGASALVSESGQTFNQSSSDHR